VNAGENNIFHHNNFVNNGDSGQAYDMCGNNYWFDGESSQGNFWSDYTGIDNDSNGIGDEPRVIAGGGGQDTYPLMRQQYSSTAGTVTDFNSNPIANVQVLFSGTNLGVITDAQGRYQYDSLWAGYAYMRFEKDGYLTCKIDFVPLTQITTQNAVLQFEDDIKDNELAMPSRTQLLPNYPNPFNARTTIRFDLAKTSPVELAIYDIAGALVTCWEYQTLEAGRHDVVWDAEAVASGVYFVKVKAGGDSQIRRIVLLK
jgi:hypothetical protein